jgi:putative tryptophan/tyrosine transport system substrate-binding protein
MRRREFIAGLGSAAAAGPVLAQQRAMPVVGYLGALSREASRDGLAAFLRGLAESGFVEGRNVAVEYRWAEEHYERLPTLAADLVRRRVDVIASLTSTAALLAAKAATQDIPIVFTTATDPVETGLVASLNRPGGNLTGVAVLNGELAAKRLEMLHEIAPAAKLIAYLSNPANAAVTRAELTAAETGAGILGVKLVNVSASTPGEVEAAFENLIRQRAEALVVSSDAFLMVTQKDQIIAFAARHRIPTIYPRRENPVAGGLMSYGTDLKEANRQVGVYAGRILKGEKPADLPVQAPNKYDLVINLKTAKALGLTIPETLLATADEVIQ